jgi:hypothetical protein
VTDISRLKPKSSPYLVDELAEFDVSQRTQVMYDTLKNIALKVPLKNYLLISRERCGWSISKTFALVTSAGAGAANEYAVFMYPISVRKDNILWAHLSLDHVVDAYLYYMREKDKPKKGGMIIVGDGAYSYDQRKYEMGKRLKLIGQRLEHYLLVHISYQKIYTRFVGLQWGGLSLQNSWSESWGKIVKWNLPYPERSFYEFFIPDVTSKVDLLERMSNLISWVDMHPL